MHSRRGFLSGLTASALLAASAPVARAQASRPTPAGAPGPKLLKPKRLVAGDVVGLAQPATLTLDEGELELVEDVVRALGFVPRRGPHALARHGYLAGPDEARAADLNAMFADPEVKAILAVRGGWGSARVLPHLDYGLIAKNPKALLGYSDITALHLAIPARTGLVTFHGPVGVSRWSEYQRTQAFRVLVDGETALLAPPSKDDKDLVRRDHRVRTLTPGRARGRLLGGNLTVLTALLGTPYLPSFEGAVLFLEDVREEPYRVDRMLTQLALAGVLKQLAGFVFGTCSRCEPGEGSYASLTLREILQDHVGKLGIPAWHNAVIGHQEEQWTLPCGLPVEIDAEAGTIQLLEPAVL